MFALDFSRVLKYSPAEARDSHGRWTGGEAVPTGYRQGFVSDEGHDYSKRGLDHTELGQKILGNEEWNSIRTLLQKGYVRYWVRHGEVALNFEAGQPKASENALTFLHDNMMKGDRIYLDLTGKIPEVLRGPQGLSGFFFDNLREANRAIRIAGGLSVQDVKAAIDCTYASVLKRGNPYHDKHTGEFTFKDRGEFEYSPSDALDEVIHGGIANIAREDVRTFLKKAAKSLGDPNLAHVHVSGTPIFDKFDLGIPRNKMPQIPKKMRGDFINEVRAKGVQVKSESVHPFSLHPSQREISARAVGERLRDYDSEAKKGFAPLLVSKDNFILDGHHHWGVMAVLALDHPNISVPIQRLMIGHQEALQLMYAYNKKHGIARQELKAAQEGFFQRLAHIFKINTHHDAKTGEFASTGGQGTQAGLLKKWGSTKAPNETGFLLSDGTRIKKTPAITHIEMANLGESAVAGAKTFSDDWFEDQNLYKVLDEGAIRYVPKQGIYLSRTPTESQAETIVDDWKYHYVGEPLRVDYVLPETKGGRSSYKTFKDVPTATALRNWVKKQYFEVDKRGLTVKCGLSSVLKFNANHDTHTGEFTTGTSDPQHIVDRLRARAEGKNRIPHEDYQPVKITTNPRQTHFLLPDGTRLAGQSGMEHGQVLFESLVGPKGDEDPNIEDALAAGVIRYSGGYGGVQIGSPLTEKQAALIADDWNILYKSPLAIDAWKGKDLSYERFDTPINADKIRRWTENVFASQKWDFVRIFKFNPNHDEIGRFATTNSGGSFEEDRQKFNQLKTKWAEVNNALLDYVDTPNAPEARAKMEELKGLVKEMYTLKADPGGVEGVGLPGGARDIVIIGAGPGGLAASVMAGTDGLDTLLIDANPKVGGQAKFSSRIENYPGFPIGTTGEHLASSMYDQAERVGAETKLGVRVTALGYDPKTGLKTMTLSNGETVTARSVILAGGVEFKKMEFGGTMSSRLEDSIVYADAKALAQKGADGTVVVMGGSNGAAQAALGVAKAAKNVIVISRSPIEKGMSDYQVQALRSNPKVHVIEGDTIEKLEEKGTASHIITKSGKAIEYKALGIFAGGKPDLSWLPSGIKLENGKIAVNNDLETAIPGVFAVGDMRNGSIGRIGAAIGDGQIAEHSVFGYFEKLKKQQAAP